jgi:coenzyme F420-0:L-glutamate ligase/coenzyme F420-1:gamma-L-glutamate ligase
VTLLPVDSTFRRKPRTGFKSASGVEIAVIITDTVGRPWREGLVDIAIGCSGIAAQGLQG